MNETPEFDRDEAQTYLDATFRDDGDWITGSWAEVRTTASAGAIPTSRGWTSLT
jgi:hypothetical protein